jgi:hypothetical protein
MFPEKLHQVVYITSNKGKHHLETKGAIDHQEDQVCDFANVDHRIDIIVAFYESEAPLFATHNSDRSLGLVESLLRVTPD